MGTAAAVYSAAMLLGLLITINVGSAVNGAMADRSGPKWADSGPKWGRPRSEPEVS